MDGKNLKRAELRKQLHRELLEEVKRRRIHRCAHLLKHTSPCEDQHCELRDCPRMMKLIQHWEANKSGIMYEDCVLCRALLNLSLQHAELCKKTKIEFRA